MSESGHRPRVIVAESTTQAVSVANANGWTPAGPGIRSIRTPWSVEVVVTMDDAYRHAGQMYPNKSDILILPNAAPDVVAYMMSRVRRPNYPTPPPPSWAGLVTYDEFLERYWTAGSPPSPAQEQWIRGAIAAENFVLTGGRGGGKTTVREAIARMFADPELENR